MRVMVRAGIIAPECVAPIADGMVSAMEFCSHPNDGEHTKGGEKKREWE